MFLAIGFFCAEVICFRPYSCALAFLSVYLFVLSKLVHACLCTCACAVHAAERACCRIRGVHSLSRGAAHGVPGFGRCSGRVLFWGAFWLDWCTRWPSVQSALERQPPSMARPGPRNMSLKCTQVYVAAKRGACMGYEWMLSSGIRVRLNNCKWHRIRLN